jgi:hypothetical protein
LGVPAAKDVLRHPMRGVGSPTRALRDGIMGIQFCFEKQCNAQAQELVFRFLLFFTKQVNIATKF